MTRTEQEKTGLTGGDKQQDDLRDSPSNPVEMPEGLERERKGPLDKDQGRNERASHVPGNQR
jgi:hypothetical protein